MPTAVIVDAVRTATGRRNGQLKDWHPVDLAAETLKALVTRTDLDPALVEDVIMGCVMQVGEQSLNVGRNAALAAGFPESVVGTTIDRQCGSSQQAAHFAAQAVMAGAHDIVIASGVEIMTRVPMGATVMSGPGLPFGNKMNERYAPVGGLVPQGISAEPIADKWNLSREELDAFSVQSHQRAARAIEEGRFEKEILPVSGADGGVFDRDEGVRPDSNVEERAKLKLSDIDLIEINEAFACVVLAWEKEHHPDMTKVNVNGGAIALGHPLCGSGAKLMTTLLNELERTGGRYGLQTMCEGGGMANATII